MIPGHADRLGGYCWCLSYSGSWRPCREVSLFQGLSAHNLATEGVVTMGLFLSGHREFRSTAYENTALYKFKKVDVEEDGPQYFTPG